MNRTVLIWCLSICWQSWIATASNQCNFSVWFVSGKKKPHKTVWSECIKQLTYANWN